MDTDKELLELAGKAANIPHRVIGAAGGMYNCDERGWHHQWNPLVNDGDALRLATLLDIDIEFRNYGQPYVIASNHECDIEEQYCDIENDKSEAVRRVIVKYAAKIGESMP